MKLQIFFGKDFLKEQNKKTDGKRQFIDICSAR